MHHSSQPDLEMDAKLNELRAALLDLGATGEFPEGKLTDQDEGEVKFAVGFKEGKVILDFGSPVVWMGMSPEQAKELARSLLKFANPVTRPSE